MNHWLDNVLEGARVELVLNLGWQRALRPLTLRERRDLNLCSTWLRERTDGSRPGPDIDEHGRLALRFPDPPEECLA